MSRVVLVLGTGSIGMRHLQVLERVDGVEPVAVPVRSSRADELRRAGHRASRTVDEALALRPVAAVVATDTGRHLEDARRLLESGCHVLVEKPLAPSSAGLRDLSRVADAAARGIYVGCCLRFHPGLRRFREVLGAADHIHHVRVECQSYLPDWRPGTDHRRGYSARADEGGVLRDLVHEIDYASWLFGRPSEASAMLTMGTTLGIQSDAAADLAWRAPSGATVSVRLDYLTRTSRRRMTVFGEAGELTWDAIAGTVTRLPHGQAPRVETIPFDPDQMMRAQAEAFLHATDGEDPGDLATFDDGAFAVALIDAARASASSEMRAIPIAEGWS